MLYLVKIAFAHVMSPHVASFGAVLYKRVPYSQRYLSSNVSTVGMVLGLAGLASNKYRCE